MTNADVKLPSVLLLEDDTPFAEMLIESLGDEFEFERAASAEEAHLLLATRAFDILLCDHMMPGGQQGLDFLVSALARYPLSRRVLMTGYINPELLNRAMVVAGLSACLMKPLTMAELRRVLLEAIGRKP